MITKPRSFFGMKSVAIENACSLAIEVGAIFFKRLKIFFRFSPGLFVCHYRMNHCNKIVWIEQFCIKFYKNTKNDVNFYLIFIAMNDPFSLRWIFIAEILFIAMNSLFADKYTHFQRPYFLKAYCWNWISKIKILIQGVLD